MCASGTTDPPECPICARVIAELREGTAQRLCVYRRSPDSPPGYSPNTDPPDRTIVRDGRLWLNGRMIGFAAPVNEQGIIPGQSG
jgi:hypothetical protein